MLRLTLGLLTASTIASAQPQTLEGQQREAAFAVLGDPTEDARGISTSGFAQVTGGTVDRAASTDVAAGLDVRFRGVRCDPFTLGGQGRLGWRDSSAQASAEQWASVCAPLEYTQFELGHRLEWDVRPSLLAPLGMRPGKNRRETFSFHWRPVRITRADLEGSGMWPGSLVEPKPGELIVFDIDSEMSWLWSSDGNLGYHGVANAIPFGYATPKVAPWGEDRDFLAALMRSGGEFADNAASVFVWFGEIENYALGPTFVSGGIGIVSASAGEIVTDYTNEVEMTAIRAKLQIEAGTSKIHGYLKAANDLEIAADGYVIVDRRLTSGAAFDLGRSRIAFDGAFGRSRAYVPRLATRGGLVGGGALSLIRDLNKHVRASVQVEVARGYYASDATSQDFAPRWGGRALGVLQAVVRP